jgi:hypothetical protein
MPFPYPQSSIMRGYGFWSVPTILFSVGTRQDTAMPFPYNIIFGRDTAVPCPLYHSGVTGIDMKPNIYRELGFILQPNLRKSILFNYHFL